MGVVTLRPDGLHTANGWVAVNAGTGAVTTTPNDFWTYLKDDNDGTYDESPTGNMAAIALHFTNFAVPARSQIRGITPRCRIGVIRVDDGLAAVRVRLATGPVTNPTLHPTLQRVDASTTLKTHNPGTVARNPAGDLWTQLQLDQIQLRLARWYDWDRDRIAVHELYLDVDYNEAPVVTLTGPVDEDAATAGIQVTSTSTPTIEGTYSDPENDPMERAHWGVWPESVYSTWPAGFVPTLHIDPAQRTPGWVWYEGPVLTSSLLRQITTPIPNGNYEAWTAAADAGSEARYSAPVSRRWTQNVPGPPPPTVSASVDVANARIALAVTASPSTTDPATEFLRGEKQEPSGEWRALLGFERVAAGVGASVTMYDYLSDPAITTQYRVRAVRVVAGSDVVSSAATASARQTLDSWWWKVPENPPDNLRVMPVDEGQQMGLVRAKVEQAAEFAVLGALPVTLSARSRDHRFPVTLYFTTEAAMKDWERRYEQYRDGMLQSLSGQWFGRLGPATTIREHGPARFVDVEFSERKRT